MTMLSWLGLSVSVRAEEQNLETNLPQAYRPWSYVWISARWCELTVALNDPDYDVLALPGAPDPAKMRTHIMGFFPKGQKVHWQGGLRQFDSCAMHEIPPRLLLGSTKEMKIPLDDLGAGKSLTIDPSLHRDRLSIDLKMIPPEGVNEFGPWIESVWDSQTVALNWEVSRDKTSAKHLILFIETRTVDPYDRSLPAGDPPESREEAVRGVKTHRLMVRTQRIILPEFKLENVRLKEALARLQRAINEAAKREKTLPEIDVKLVLLPDGLIENQAEISLDLKDTPLIEVLRYVTELAGGTYKLRGEDNTVAIRPYTFEPGRIDETKTFKVPPEFFKWLAARPGGRDLGSPPGHLPAKKPLARSPKDSPLEILHAWGVYFPEGSFAKYDKASSELNVRAEFGSIYDLTDEVEKFRALPPKGVAALARQLVSPRANFRSVTFTDALAFVGKASRLLDPKGRGVEVVVAPGCDTGRRVSFSAENVSVLEQLIYIAELTGHRLHADQSGLTIAAEK